MNRALLFSIQIQAIWRWGFACRHDVANRNWIGWWWGLRGCAGRSAFSLCWCSWWGTSGEACSCCKFACDFAYFLLVWISSAGGALCMFWYTNTPLKEQKHAPTTFQVDSSQNLRVNSCGLLALWVPKHTWEWECYAFLTQFSGSLGSSRKLGMLNDRGDVFEKAAELQSIRLSPHFLAALFVLCHPSICGPVTQYNPGQDPRCFASCSTSAFGIAPPALLPESNSLLSAKLKMHEWDNGTMQFEKFSNCSSFEAGTSTSCSLCWCTPNGGKSSLPYS